MMLATIGLSENSDPQIPNQSMEIRTIEANEVKKLNNVIEKKLSEIKFL